MRGGHHGGFARRRFARIVWLIVANAFASCALVACSDERESVIDVVVSEIEPGLPDRLDELRLSVTIPSADAEEHVRTEVTRATYGTRLLLPWAIRLQPRSESDAGRVVYRVRASGWRGGREYVSSQARLVFVPGGRVVLPLRFEPECVDAGCGGDGTCRAGACVDDNVASCALVVGQPPSFCVAQRDASARDAEATDADGRDRGVPTGDSSADDLGIDGLDSSMRDLGIDGLDSSANDLGTDETDAAPPDSGPDGSILDAAADGSILDAGTDMSFVDAAADMSVTDAGSDMSVRDSGTGRRDTGTADSGPADSATADSGGAPLMPCADIDLGSATGVVFMGNLMMAADDETLSCTTGRDPDLVFQWSAPRTARWVFHTCGASGLADTALELRRTCSSDPLACNDEAVPFSCPSAFLSSRVEIDLAAGERVLVFLEANIVFGATQLTIMELSGG